MLARVNESIKTCGGIGISSLDREQSGFVKWSLDCTYILKLRRNFTPTNFKAVPTLTASVRITVRHLSQQSPLISNSNGCFCSGVVKCLVSNGDTVVQIWHRGTAFLFLYVFKYINFHSSRFCSIFLHSGYSYKYHAIVAQDFWNGMGWV